MSGDVPIVRRLAASGELNAASLNHLIDQGAAPLVEPDTCTFFYRGPPTRSGWLHWGVGLPPNLDFTRLAGTELWYLVLELQRGSRVEYKLEVAEPGGHRIIEDPLNPRKAHNPFGANSVCLAYGYETPTWAEPDPLAGEGTLKDHVLTSSALGRPAHTTLYLPPGFDAASTVPHPLLVVHDGGDYLHYAQLKTVLDNLIHRRRVPPLVAAFSHPGRTADRVRRRPPPRPLPDRRAGAGVGGRAAPGGPADRPGPHGRQLRCRRVTRGRVPRPRSTSAVSCCSRARSPGRATAAASGASRSGSR